MMMVMLDQWLNRIESNQIELNGITYQRKISIGMRIKIEIGIEIVIETPELTLTNFK